MSNTNAKLNYLVKLAVLTAIIILMTFTPLGFLKLPTVEITLLVIPVAVGAIVCGPAAGAFLGLVFGLTSFFQCFGLSAFGTALFNVNAFFTFVLCLIPRVMAGFLPALLFKWLNRIDKTKILSYAAASFSVALVNTLLFSAGLVLLFGHSDFIRNMMAGKQVLAFLVAFVGINGIVEAIVCMIAGGSIGKALAFYSKKNT